MQQRYYDPRVGRFWSVDPVTVDGAGRNFNRYWYANNNPYGFTDPDGRLADVLIDAAFTVYDAGRFLGAATAAAVGTATSDASLQAEGLKGMRDSGIDLGASVVSAVVPGLAAPITRTAARSAEAAIDAGKKLPIPSVDDAKLANLVNDLYKGAKGPNPIGTGSTADAIRNEIATGLPTHGTFHSEKGRQYMNALGNWVRRNPDAAHHDQLVAETLKRDLQDALGGK